MSKRVYDYGTVGLQYIKEQKPLNEFSRDHNIPRASLIWILRKLEIPPVPAVQVPPCNRKLEPGDYIRKYPDVVMMLRNHEKIGDIVRDCKVQYSTVIACAKRFGIPVSRARSHDHATDPLCIKIVDALKSGATIPEIENEFHVSRKKAYQLADENGIPRPHRNKKRKGKDEE